MKDSEKIEVRRLMAMAEGLRDMAQKANATAASYDAKAAALVRVPVAGAIVVAPRGRLMRVVNEHEFLRLDTFCDKGIVDAPEDPLEWMNYEVLQDGEKGVFEEYDDRVSRRAKTDVEARAGSGLETDAEKAAYVGSGLEILKAGGDDEP
jgi:hypothetical protein